VNRSIIFIPTVFLALATSSTPAQVSGGKVVRVDDATGIAERCIDPYKDRVWLTLRSLTVSKSKQWFTKDKDVSVVINAKVQTDPAPPTPISFPLMSVARFGEGPVGQVSVPIEYAVVSGLVLKQGTIIYSGIGAEITLVNIKDRNGLGSALQALDAITSSAKLPIPASPYTQAATYLTAFANSAVQKDIDAQKDDKAVAGSVQFNFDPEGTCLAGDFERTGTKAIIFSEGNQAELGYVDLAKIDQYCYRASLSPVFSLTVAHRPASGDCRILLNNQFKTVANNFVGLYLNKQTVSRVLGPSSSQEIDKRESLARCKANGISQEAACLAFDEK